MQNHALRRTRPSRSGCNPRVPRVSGGSGFFIQTFELPHDLFFSEPPSSPVPILLILPIHVNFPSPCLCAPVVFFPVHWRFFGIYVFFVVNPPHPAHSC